MIYDVVLILCSRRLPGFHTTFNFLNCPKEFFTHRIPQPLPVHQGTPLTSGSNLSVSLPLQYSCLENPMDEGAWWAGVHGVANSQTGLRDFTFTFHFPALEKEMTTHSSVLAWRIPGTGEPGGLPSMGSHRVGHD